MAINLQGQSFLTLKDFTPRQIRYLLDLSHDLKQKKRMGIRAQQLVGKNIALIFEKSSTRTRCAFEVAGYDEGARVTFLSQSQMGKKESIEDTAKVLGRFYDGIEFRGFEQTTVECLAEHSGVPVWNGLTDLYHPTQILADFMTIEEHCHKPLSQVKLVFVGDARNNMGNSLMIGAAKMGMHFVALAPKTLFPDQGLTNEMQALAQQTGATIELTDDIKQAVQDVDVIYTDVWVSMGEEDQIADRIALLKDYQVTQQMLQQTHNSAVIFMHCLPACHDDQTELGKFVKETYQMDAMEVTDQVFRSHHSVVFDQAENRLHSIKAVMVATIGS